MDTKVGVEQLTQLEMGRERGINARTITQEVKFIPRGTVTGNESDASGITGPKG